MQSRTLVMLLTVVLLITAPVATLLARGAAEEVEPESEFIDGRYEPPITLTTPMSVHDPDEWPEGDSFEYNAFTRWVESELGIQFEPSWRFPDHETNVERLGLAAAAGDMPDFVYAPDEDIARLARDGALIPLDDIVEEYASPLTQHFIDIGQEAVDGTLFYPTTVDGEFYGMPHSPENVWDVNWIRTDLLDELGLDIPRTLDDLEEALAAYKDAYEKPGFALAEDLTAADMVFHAHGGYPGLWVENDDGELEYGSIQPEVRDALARLNTWYEEGWIDQEFVVHGWDQAILEPAAAGDLFVTHGPWWFIWWPWVGLWEENPDAQIVAFSPLENLDGEVMAMLDSPFYGWSTGVSVNAEYPEALMHLLNEKIDSYHRNNEELRDLMADRGYEFKYPVTERQEPLNPEAEEPFLYQYEYEHPGWGFFNDGTTHFNRAMGFFLYSEPDPWFGPDGQHFEIYDAHHADAIDELPAELRDEYRNLRDIERRLDSHFHTVETIRDLRDRDAIEYNRYLGAPTPAMAENEAYLSRIEEEAFVQIIMGEEPIEHFDEFVEQWLAGGGIDVTEEVNEWYRGVE